MNDYVFKNIEIKELVWITSDFFDTIYDFRIKNIWNLIDSPDSIDINESIEKSRDLTKFMENNCMWDCYFYFLKIEKIPVNLLLDDKLNSNQEIRKILYEIIKIKKYILKSNLYSRSSFLHALESEMIKTIIELDEKIDEIKRENKLTHNKKVKYMI